jgi:hypothetical protein
MISEWLWTKISGPVSFNIIKPTDSIAKVKALVVGSYQFELKVKDNGGLFARDTIRIIVDSVVTPNHPPIANAGADQTITLPTNNVTLDGSSSNDPDNNIISYLWTKISGPSSFNIVNSNSVQTQLTNLIEGVYEFELKVTDAGGLVSRDTMQVIVITADNSACNNSSRPLVNAQLVPLGLLSQARVDIAVGAAGNKILFAGGSDGETRVDIYDFNTQSWSTAELSEARENFTSVSSGNKIFFAGGEISSTVDIYDVSTNTWSVSSLSQARWGLTSAAVGDKVFFAGGSTGYFPPSDRVDIYDLVNNSWSTATLSEARSFLSAETANNKIYFTGGWNEYSTNFNPTDKIDIYDNASGLWSTSAMNEPKVGMESIAVGNKIFWAGGATSNSNGITPSDKVEVRDVNTQSSSFACLFQPNTWGYNNQKASVKSNKIVFFTGVTHNKFDIYDLSANAWSIGVLPVSIEKAAIISVNNIIYVAGGFVNGVLSNQVWKLEF